MYSLNDMRALWLEPKFLLTVFLEVSYNFSTVLIRPKRTIIT